MRKIICTYAIALCCTALVRTQTITLVADGFTSPTGLSLDDTGNLWVVETGSGADDGEVDMISPSGTVYPVITGLPSHFDPATFETTGPWHVYHRPGNKLTVITGSGPNENAGSLITFDLSSFTAGDAPITVADAIDIMHISTYALASGFAESDPYTAAWDADGNIYISDAAANAIFMADAISGEFSILDTFPAIPNTFTPFPPFIDYVPTAIINAADGGFYLCNLTGFPFLPELSEVLHINTDGSTSVYTSGLTQSVDMDLDEATGDLYVLQFGLYDTSFMPVFSSAQITRISSSGDTSVFAEGFGPSAGMVVDGSGGAYVSSLFTGEVLHITFPVSIEQSAAEHTSIIASPNPFSTTTDVLYTISASETAAFIIYNLEGNKVYEEFIPQNSAGRHTFHWKGTDNNNLPVSGGVYFITLIAGEQHQIIKVIKN